MFYVLWLTWFILWQCCILLYYIVWSFPFNWRKSSSSLLWKSRANGAGIWISLNHLSFISKMSNWYLLNTVIIGRVVSLTAGCVQAYSLQKPPVTRCSTITFNEQLMQGKTGCTGGSSWVGCWFSTAEGDAQGSLQQAWASWIGALPGGWTYYHCTGHNIFTLLRHF